MPAPRPLITPHTLARGGVSVVTIPEEEEDVTDVTLSRFVPGVVVGVSLGGAALAVGEAMVMMVVTRPCAPRPGPGSVSGRGLLITSVITSVPGLGASVGPHHHGLCWPHVAPRGPGLGAAVAQGLGLELNIEAPGAWDTAGGELGAGGGGRGEGPGGGRGAARGDNGEAERGHCDDLRPLASLKQQDNK